MRAQWVALVIIFQFGLLNICGANSKGKVLVVLSSEDKITLKDNSVHPTGFFLPELMGPAKMFLDEGYSLEFANPKGTPAVMDKVSDSPIWFGEIKETAQGEYTEHRELCEQLGLCGPPGTLKGSLRLKTLAEVKKQLGLYAGVFVPGGHAPMEDLWKDADLGAILRYFHNAKKPTGLICHAPVALLSTMDDPIGYIDAKLKDDRATMVAKKQSWIYKGYSLTVFTTREEQQEEPGEDNALGGFVKFYPDEVLEKAGAYVNRADKWKSNVVVSNELITGQNPLSHHDFGKALLEALRSKALRDNKSARIEIPLTGDAQLVLDLGARVLLGHKDGDFEAEGEIRCRVDKEYPIAYEPVPPKINDLYCRLSSNGKSINIPFITFENADGTKEELSGAQILISAISSQLEGHREDFDGLFRVARHGKKRDATVTIITE